MVTITTQVVVVKAEDNMSLADGFWFGLGLCLAFTLSLTLFGAIGALFQYLEEKSNGQSKIL